MLAAIQWAAAAPWAAAIPRAEAIPLATAIPCVAATPLAAACEGQSHPERAARSKAPEPSANCDARADGKAVWRLRPRRRCPQGRPSTSEWKPSCGSECGRGAEAGRCMTWRGTGAPTGRVGVSWRSADRRRAVHCPPVRIAGGLARGSCWWAKAGFEQIRGNLDQAWCAFGQLWPNFGQISETSTKMGSLSAHSGTCSSKLRPVWQTSGRSGSHSVWFRSRLGHVDRMWGGSGQHGPASTCGSSTWEALQLRGGEPETPVRGFSCMRSSTRRWKQNVAIIPPPWQDGTGRHRANLARVRAEFSTNRPQVALFQPYSDDVGRSWSNSVHARLNIDRNRSNFGRSRSNFARTRPKSHPKPIDLGQPFAEFGPDWVDSAPNPVEFAQEDGLRNATNRLVERRASRGKLAT